MHVHIDYIIYCITYYAPFLILEEWLPPHCHCGIVVREDLNFSFKVNTKLVCNTRTGVPHGVLEKLLQYICYQIHAGDSSEMKQV